MSGAFYSCCKQCRQSKDCNSVEHGETGFASILLSFFPLVLGLSVIVWQKGQTAQPRWADSQLLSPKEAEPTRRVL